MKACYAKHRSLELPQQRDKAVGLMDLVYGADAFRESPEDR